MEIRNAKGQFISGARGFSPMQGKKHTEEWKQNMSRIVTGRKVTWGDKISLAHKGKKISEETRKKISESKKGKNMGEQNYGWKGGWRNNLANCLICNIKVKSYSAKYCGKHKPVVFVPEAPRGEKNHMWKGGISKHPKYATFATRKHRTLKRNAMGTHNFEQWESLKKFYDYMCLCCKKQEPIITLTEDHIIPLSKGGSNNIDNIQPLCKSCNSIKRTKTTDFRLTLSPIIQI